MAPHARPINTKATLAGTLALAFFAALPVTAGYWWYEHCKPGQTSKADCVLAQKIIDKAQKLPHNRAALEHELRRSQRPDGYLGLPNAGVKLSHSPIAS